MMYRTRRLPWRNSFPRSGSCCVSNNPRGFLYLSAEYCCHWQDWPTCKVSPSKKLKKKDSIETGLHLAHLQSHWNWESDQQKIILILMTVPMMSSQTQVPVSLASAWPS